MTKTQSVTKKDLEKLATKEELEENVKRLEKAIEANRKAIKSLEERSLAFEWKIEKKIDSYQQEVKKMITNFKDEILRHLNGAVRELETTREEQTIMGHQLTKHEEKLGNHEKRITHLESG